LFSGRDFIDLVSMTAIAFFGFNMKILSTTGADRTRGGHRRPGAARLAAARLSGAAAEINQEVASNRDRLSVMYNLSIYRL
jgi:hypothetical protein